MAIFANRSADGGDCVAHEFGRDVVDVLAGVAGFEVPAGDRELLTAILRNQLAAVRVLAELDVQDVEPIVSFDPRWR